MHVLVVDDDCALCDALKEHLESEGHHVRAAHDGRDALESLSSGFRANVIVLDLLMPGMDEWDFRATQLADPSISSVPVVILSGSGFTVHTIVRQLHVADYLMKPLNPASVSNVLTRIAGAES